MTAIRKVDVFTAGCPACVGDYSAEDRARFRERQKQIDLAAKRGESHLGG